ncbi:hypothetical protein VAR608DRAFT_0831 [Variovorax sp. HW608]|uniref:hypothetical protein n=1 Tax=Variovorax sp. HW608 TaxID=1034889 RepID=UPI00081FA790|nr:hypothetical protein [Variovorax sp. HW608]SCK13878.1 hypothetical protein VAR608DRAFT_0831 [Variovorax sp. HW608]
MLANRLLRIIWPAFLAACILELMVFAFVDPMDSAPGWSRQAVYTIAFFTFWVVSAGTCFLATLLHPTPDEAKRANEGRLVV